MSRTESTAYPESFDVRGALSLQVSHPTWGDYAKGLLQEGVSRPRAGVDAGDHPPITPVRALDPTVRARKECAGLKRVMGEGERWGGS